MLARCASGSRCWTGRTRSCSSNSGSTFICQWGRSDSQRGWDSHALAFRLCVLTLDTLCLRPFVSLLCSGVQKNGSVVVHLLKTKPATTRQQLQAMALLPIEEAVQWRCARKKKNMSTPNLRA